MDRSLAQERVRGVESCAVDGVINRHDAGIRKEDVVPPACDSGAEAVLLVPILHGAVLGIYGIDIVGEAVRRGRWGRCGRGGGVGQTVAVALGSRQAQRGD